MAPAYLAVNFSVKLKLPEEKRKCKGFVIVNITNRILHVHQRHAQASRECKFAISTCIHATYKNGHARLVQTLKDKNRQENAYNIPFTREMCSLLIPQEVNNIHSTVSSLWTKCEQQKQQE